MNRLLTTSLRLAAACALAALSAGPLGAALTTIGQVGAAAGSGQHYVTVLWRDLDGGPPEETFALYAKSGDPASPAPYVRQAVLTPTTHVPTLAVILQRAAAAGLDNAALERSLDALAGQPAPQGSLAEKLSYVLRGEFSDNGRFEQKALLARVFPQAAMACAAGWIGTVPSNTSTTFELREYDPATGADGKVAGRVTTGTQPAVLPAPGGAAEAVHPDPRGHLRVHLLWWLTPALRDRVPHLCGYNVYRADRQNYLDATGSPPPAALTVTRLQADLAAGLLDQVNACPVLPDLTYESAPPPKTASYFFIDDNDRSDLGRFDPGGQPFADGQRLVYYVAACDFFGRPGVPSPGLEVTVCDRMPPAAPSRLRAAPVYEEGEHFVRLRWRRDDPAEVGRYFVYCYQAADQAIPDVRHPLAPESPSLIAIVDNDGASETVTFDHREAGALTLPADAGQTRWYCIRAEDNSSCKDSEGFGNLSFPCGVVPASLYGFDPLDAPSGRLLIRCCEVEVVTTASGPPHLDTVTLRATRLHPSVQWVEFRETQHGLDLGHHEFGEAGLVQVPVDVRGLAPLQFEARFGRHTGFASAWFPGNLFSNGAPDHFWEASITCSPGRVHHPGCELHPYFPVDPDTGDTLEACGDFQQLPGEHSWRVFRRLGFDGALTLVAGGKFAENAEWCDPVVPAVSTTVCYFGQTADQDGNPSPLVLLGCLHYARPDTLPVPAIRFAETLPGADLLAPTAPARVEWHSPRPGVEDFELAIFPPAPGLPTFTRDNLTWAIVKSPRLPNGYGGDDTLFPLDLDLPKGLDHVVKVRARGFGPPDSPDERPIGRWSEPAAIKWSPAAEVQDGQLPWPYRSLPGLLPAAQPLAEYHTSGFETIGRVSIGIVPNHVNVIPSSSPTTGDLVDAETLAPFLTKQLPLAVYRHESSPGARHEMVQISPLIREFWEPSGSPGQVVINDPFVMVGKPAGAKPSDPYHIWVRDVQPLIAGKTYRYTLACFGSDGELTGALPSVEFTPQP